MGKHQETLTEPLIEFIEKQKIFFVGTATENSRVNVSPKGMDSLRVLNPNRVLWLNVTGSGNETAAHVQQSPRMTLMFCAFEGPPLILRLYGTARVIHMNDPDWELMYNYFDPLPGARQLFDLSIEMVQSSCGMAVPNYEYIGERELLNEWAATKGDEGIRQYWIDKNQTTIDNIPTHIIEKNL